MSNPVKARFVITTMVHSEGEVELGENGEDVIHIKVPQFSPVCTIISENELSEEDQARIKLMALHQQMTTTLKAVTPSGMKVESNHPITQVAPKERS